MPKFDPSKNPQHNEDPNGVLVVPEAWTEPRCHVCQSKHRHTIDRLLALGTGFGEISRIFGGEIDRRSIANHNRRHLGYERAAIRQIIETEAKAAEVDAEQGISGIVKRKAFLETALHKAFQQVQSDNVVIETKDAVQIIEALNRFDKQTEGSQLDVIKVQFNAFLQAIREIATQRGDPSLGSDIWIRAREIAGIQMKEPPQLGA